MALARKCLDAVLKAMLFVSAVLTALMVLITCADVLMRRLGTPVFGIVEIVGFMYAIILAYSLAYTHKERGHIAVEILMITLPARVQAITSACVALVSLLMFGVIGWRFLLYAWEIQKSNELSWVLQFPHYTIIYAMAPGFFLLFIVILDDLVHSLKRGMQK